MKFKGLENIGVSVVIVSFNGKNKIKPTLEHLSCQQGIDFDWEVVLVDNKSTDNTGVVAQEVWNNSGNPCPFRVIREEKAGTMFARQNGMVNSTYRYLLYCDDDNWLPDYYVKYAFERIHSEKNIAGVGGCGILEFEKDFDIPKWVDKCGNMLGAGPQGDEDGDTTNDKGCLYTAGTIFDKVWLEKLYSAGFSPLLKGRDGKSLVAGEDTELTYALKLIGGKLHYYSKMKFKHFMPAERITWSYIVKLAKAIAKSNYLLRPYCSSGQSDIFVDYLKTSGLIVKYFFKSLYHGFEKGNDNVINLYKFIGRFQILKYARKHHFKTKNMISVILKNSARSPSICI